MRNGPYLVETSLISNRLLEYMPDPAQHLFIEYLRFGIPVCLNTDDSGVWDSNLTDEYFTALTTSKPPGMRSHNSAAIVSNIRFRIQPTMRGGCRSTTSACVI